MASSTTGERRWASSRRGGMTVLGKVAVPKPINLPSQRLENHGLDPNVEIVPKGTLSWGSRPSSSGSNAWGSSSVLSPRTEVGSVSPSYFGGRPSSGGGTRPSTAGSETTLDSTSNIWTSNSRPSSASGPLASSNTLLTTMRPRSAETRPGSSQLSRFAELSAEGSGAWGTSGAADKLEIASSTGNEFALSSGDFPALGSEKNSEKNTESLVDSSSHGHPGLCPGRPSASTVKLETTVSDEVSRTKDVNNGMDNSWGNDGPEHIKDGPQPGIGRWHGEPYPYMNPNIPPHPRDTWYGAPSVNPSGGVWYRGPPRPPYGAPIAPNGFPMEPFPYYRPQVPAPGVASSQTVPPESARSHGQHSKGESYRPIMEPYMHPGMPVRPGFYPRYCVPPVNFHNLNEQDFPFMGIPTGHPAYNGCPNQNAPERNTSDAKSSGGRAVEHVECGLPNDSQGRINPPVKHNGNSAKNQDADWWGPKVVVNARGHYEGNVSKSSSQENAWGEDHREYEQMNHEKGPLASEAASSLSSNDKIGSTDTAYGKFRGNVQNTQSVDLNLVENVPSPREHALIRKIEGLNAKVRDSDGRYNLHREEPCSRVPVVDSKPSQPINEANAGVHLERHQPSGILAPVSRDRSNSAGDKGHRPQGGSVTTFSRHSSRNMQGRGDHESKSGSDVQEADGWRKRSAVSESQSVASVVNPESNIVQGQEWPPAVQFKEISRSGTEVKDEATLTTVEPCDNQRAKMREIAKQRAIQLQREEDKRVKEQRAKAFAKLEELNRRSASQGKEASRQKIEKMPSHTTDLLKQEESIIWIEPQSVSHQSGEAISTIAHCSDPSQTNEGSERKVLSTGMLSETKQNVHLDPVRSQYESIPATDDARIDDVAGHQNVLQVHEISRQKPLGYIEKYNVYSGKNLIERSIIADAKDENHTSFTASKEVDGKEVSLSFGSNLPVEPLTNSYSILHPKRKYNKSGKSKQKVDESSDVSSTTVLKSVTESVKQDTGESNHEPMIQPSIDSKDAMQSTNIHLPLPHEDAQGKANSILNPQHAIKVSRNSQGRSKDKSYSSDAVVWAPVKSQIKIEVIDDSNMKAAGAAGPSTRIDNAVPSISKSKRAEMERYVPKAAVKELALQENVQQLAFPSTEQSILEDMSTRGKVSSPTTGKIGRPVESRHLDAKPKQMKPHSSWRQRVSTESKPVQGLEGSSSSTLSPIQNSQTSDGARPSQRPNELAEGSADKPNAQLVKGQPLKCDGLPMKGKQEPGNVDGDNAFDGWNIVDEPVSSRPATFVKDHKTSGGGKRLPFKGHNGSGNRQYCDNKNQTVAEAETELSLTANQSDRPISSEENRVARWQPKAQTHAINQQRNCTRGWQTVTDEGDKIFKREKSHNGGMQLASLGCQDTAKDMARPQPHSVSESRDFSKRPMIASHETERERKADPSKGRPYSPSDDLSGEVESAPLGITDGNNKQHPSSSGHRRNGNYNGRFHRGHEFHGDQSYIMRESRQNYTSADRERHRHNFHYEYQPVRSYSTSKGNDSKGQTENRHVGQRFRDRGQGGHSQHGGGNFYGRKRDYNQRNDGHE